MRETAFQSILPARSNSKEIGDAPHQTCNRSGGHLSHFDALGVFSTGCPIIDTVADDLRTWDGIPSQGNTEGVGISGVEGWDGIVEQDKEENGF